MIVGYARVSTQEQNLQMQMDELQKFGCFEIFEEKITGTKRDRPALNEMIKMLREGDRVVVYKLDRISRSTKHLIELTELFEEKGVEFVSIKDNIDTSTATGRFFFRMMASIAELERDIISERTKAGLSSARARGRVGGRPKTPTKSIETALKMYHSKDYSISEIVKATGVSQSTLYRNIDKINSKNEELNQPR
ncbi:recombinase family protein [Peribacillus sp. TH24]|uniref:recombinase family protein n=1 Tax=Peribacillus sp. TH24 TaxID=2798483 RepID=UPI0019139BD9|nr:recombinase family protein [Peribacillus sp. TH24]MBK5447044.1 recombinase family protein [Peribacillus sp. TH24]MBK5447075.1 recombinase family protein [Peribacillus sp. TH24]